MAMPLAKLLRRKPREVAAEIVGRLGLAGLCQPPEIAGPGFINLRIEDDWLVAQLQAAVNDPRLGIPTLETPRTFVVDYSAPNVAKPMHVGHIRSTVIGDALCRVLRFLGHTAIGDNHIGDWGTQFGMILYGWKHFRDEEAFHRNPVEELARLYKLVRQLMDFQKPGEEDEEEEAGFRIQGSGDGGQSDGGVAQSPIPNPQSPIPSLSVRHPDIAAAVLAETAKLHAGDPENRRLWKQFLPFCEDEIRRVYRRLDVTFDHTLGESFYEDRLAPWSRSFRAAASPAKATGQCASSLRARRCRCWCGRKTGHSSTARPTWPRSATGWRRGGPTRSSMSSITGNRCTSSSFSPLPGCWATAAWNSQHVSFGTVLGDDGRPFKTRSGTTVGLEGLLDEAVRRALAIVSENDDAKPDGRELSDEDRRQVAESVGIAALKYADLSQNRTSDYVFSYDKMLAMNGNTATYMQYAYARVRSIFAGGTWMSMPLRASGAPITLARGGGTGAGARAAPLFRGPGPDRGRLSPEPTDGLFVRSGQSLLDVFRAVPRAPAETPELRQSRLLLCDLTARTIRQGLELLGIRVVEKM